MNHCSMCGVKIGDWPLTDALMDVFQENSEPVTKVTIDFELTAWEKKALKNGP